MRACADVQNVKARVPRARTCHAKRDDDRQPAAGAKFNTIRSKPMNQRKITVHNSGRKGRVVDDQIGSQRSQWQCFLNFRGNERTRILNS